MVNENVAYAKSSERDWVQNLKKKENPKVESILKLVDNESKFIINDLIESNELNLIIDTFSKIKSNFNNIEKKSLGEKKNVSKGFIIRKKIDIYAPNKSLLLLNSLLKIFENQLEALSVKLKKKGLLESSILIKLFLETQKKIILILQIIDKLQENNTPYVVGIREQIKIKNELRHLFRAISLHIILRELFN